MLYDCSHFYGKVTLKKKNRFDLFIYMMGYVQYSHWLIKNINISTNINVDINSLY